MIIARSSLVETLIAVLVAGGAIAFDLWQPSAIGGVLAVVGMIGALLWLGGEFKLRELLRAHRVTLPLLLRLEVALLVGCVGLLAARLALIPEQLQNVGEETQHAHAARVYDGVFLALTLIAELVLWRLRLAVAAMLRLGKRPQMLLATSFLAMILVSTVLLCLPWSVHDVDSMRLVDEFFTATSAVCVTGLSVHDVGTHYTAFGQFVLLLSIQLGGIGIMTIGAAAVALMRDGSLVAQARYASMMDAGSLAELRGLMRTIVTTTLSIELVGALLLWGIWSGDPRMEGHSAAWAAVFHSISAFCNAGFSLFPRGMCDFTSSYATQFVLMTLIVLGGLGFPVYRALALRARDRTQEWLTRRPNARRPLDLGARVVLTTTGILIAVGALMFAVLEWGRGFESLGILDTVMAALFSSVTTRTAGFNTVDFGAFGPAALLFTMVLMWIGGSPSSTAGGIKTTAAAALFANFVGELRGHEPRLFGRTLGQETIRRASAVASLSLATVGGVIFLLTLTEQQEFLQLAFEAVSAFGTVGLSTGMTPELSSVGRLILSVTMFVGRTGPMTAALAIGAAAARERFRLPSTELSVW